MTIKINSLELENVKRIKAVKIEPTQNGLTVIGGRNAQGKTSVLDAIAWALGGNKFKPSRPERDGSVVPPSLKVTLSNGLIVERKGKNSDLKVTDPTGRKAGQKLLDSFIEELALNLPKFMSMSSKDKANELLSIIGVGEDLAKLTMKEQSLYNDRLVIGRIAKQKKAAAKEMGSYSNVPEDFISVKELIDQQQSILAKNGENARKRAMVGQYERDLEWKEKQLEELQKKTLALLDEIEMVKEDLTIARKDAMDLVDESTEELEQNIQQVEEINNKIRENKAKAEAEAEAKGYETQYVALTRQIDDVRSAKVALLNGADLPLPGLSVDEDNDITYKNQKWDNMSSAEQLMVATAIVRKLNPNCGFVLLDKLEQMDYETMLEFGQWLEKEGIQAIATRVSTGGECSVIITDGYGEFVKEQIQKPTWKEGVF